ncbi:adhesion G-protein coupled receptor D1-like [Gigantopelta aegis]|uniref:adhesion G-protein coupled receptor D1-like n=1 Tax=Gigantopelta aegis TaxID=1735272 RepID=UPI001B88E3A6|nr:adhesion G-protein coupled receptor D1-like [Gigantopelta aegis]
MNVAENVAVKASNSLRTIHLCVFLLTGVPLIVVGISFAVFYEHYGNGDICWLNNETLLVCFVPTVGLVVIINSIVLIIVLRVMMRSLHSTTKVTVQEKSSLKMGLKATAILLPLLGLTWTLAFFTISSERELAIVFTYLFTISNSFQGVMFFVFHCLLNVDVHSAFERRYPRKKTMSSIDTSMTKVKRSSSLGVCLNEQPRGKPSVDTQFTDISVNDSRHSSSSSNGHLHLEKQSSAYSNSSNNGHLRLINQTSSTSDCYSNGHRPVGRHHSSGFEDFDADDRDNVWRRYSLENEEAFPDVTRQNSAFHPDVVFVNSWGFETKHRKKSTSLSDYGEQL